ncbi:hypothetical protein E2C01_083645 [Portunus trituberculatus]|uniref:Uncharacterized protein n=1 Tax=Portunus trituberculatus TaxID=210409 RepID=A0A5B7J467_PORTR|nr:hypothetical protein [Portunus trituberculatus]
MRQHSNTQQHYSSSTKAAAHHVTGGMTAGNRRLRINQPVSFTVTRILPGYHSSWAKQGSVSPHLQHLSYLPHTCHICLSVNTLQSIASPAALPFPRRRISKKSDAAALLCLVFFGLLTCGAARRGAMGPWRLGNTQATSHTPTRGEQFTESQSIGICHYLSASLSLWGFPRGLALPFALFCASTSLSCLCVCVCVCVCYCHCNGEPVCVFLSSLPAYLSVCPFFCPSVCHAPSLPVIVSLFVFPLSCTSACLSV